MHNIKDTQKDIVTFEKKNESFQSFVDRAKKIVTAIFMITDIVDEQSGIDVILRQKSIAHFQCFLDYIKDNDPKHLMESQHQLYETLSFIEILYSARLITEMNYNIISGEIRDFQKSLRQKIEIVKQKKPILSELFFSEKTMKLDNIQKKESDIQKKELLRSDKEIRHENIIKVLGEKKQASITDICTFFEGYSAKTLQRDLKELIKNKKVMKKGERRWATYSLV